MPGRGVGVQFSMMESVTMEKSSHGGVVNLLRMAKTQCGAGIAFAALRKSDGHFAIATFPGLAIDSAWDIEAIDELVRQAWADPHLSGGKVLVRSGRVVAGRWPEEGGPVKLAVAPLSDFGSLDRPWGLLCVADPVSGQFGQEHLDLLGTMAVRLTSYLRARQEVLDEGPVEPEPGPYDVADLGGQRAAWPTAAEEAAVDLTGFDAPQRTRRGADPFETLLQRKAGDRVLFHASDLRESVQRKKAVGARPQDVVEHPSM